MLTLPELKQAVADAEEVAAAAPFIVEAHYISFLKEDPSAVGLAAFDEQEVAGESATVRGRVVHLLTDTKDQLHTAKLPGGVERRLGVATNRNLTVVRELVRRWGHG